MQILSAKYHKYFGIFQLPRPMILNPGLHIRIPLRALNTDA